MPIVKSCQYHTCLANWFMGNLFIEIEILGQKTFYSCFLRLNQSIGWVPRVNRQIPRINVSSDTRPGPTDGPSEWSWWLVQLISWSGAGDWSSWSTDLEPVIGRLVQQNGTGRPGGGGQPPGQQSQARKSFVARLFFSLWNPSSRFSSFLFLFSSRWTSVSSCTGFATLACF